MQASLAQFPKLLTRSQLTPVPQSQNCLHESLLHYMLVWSLTSALSCQALWHYILPQQFFLCCLRPPLAAQNFYLDVIDACNFISEAIDARRSSSSTFSVSSPNTDKISSSLFSLHVFQHILRSWWISYPIRNCKIYWTNEKKETKNLISQYSFIIHVLLFYHLSNL